MSDLQKAFAIADEWIDKHGPLNFDGQVESFSDENGNEISRLAFAFKLAEWQLKKQGAPIQKGGIEISFGFMADWGIQSNTQQTYMDMCNAWTLDGGEPRALMANVRPKQKR